MNSFSIFILRVAGRTLSQMTGLRMKHRCSLGSPGLSLPMLVMQMVKSADSPSQIYKPFSNAEKSNDCRISSIGKARLHFPHSGQTAFTLFFAKKTAEVGSQREGPNSDIESMLFDP